MIGYRGVLRYTREPDIFGLELDAVRKVWDAGQRNLHVMLPFVRSTRELRRCRELIPRARELGLRTSICGQAPSVHPEYAELLVRAGIDAISVSVDVVDRTRALVAAEQRVLLDAARAKVAVAHRERLTRKSAAPC